MFKKIKKWGERIFERISYLRYWSTVQVTDLSTDSVGSDPRELPRPDRRSSLDILSFYTSSTEAVKHKIKAEIELCTCENCELLSSEFGECPICTEPLQTSATPEQGISACPSCGNICCFHCAQKLTSCPFCRCGLFLTLSDRVRCVALERLLAKLKLPCRNARYGCKVHLTLKNRLEHEIICSFSPVKCPLIKYCGWLGEGANIIQHLRKAHNISVVPANGIDMEIGDFRAKLKMANEKHRKYCLSLICHGNIYMCKINIYRNKLKLCIQQIDGTFFNNFERNLFDERKFVAVIEVRTKFKTLKTLLPVGRNIKDVKQVEIPCEALLSNSGKDNDLVKISITIKQANS